MIIRANRKQLCQAIVLALVPVCAAQAQTPATTVPQKVEKIEVTGSNIKRVDADSSSPIQIITKEQIQQTGLSSLAEVLRDVPAISGGSANDFDSGTGFQRGNQTASLRGLGSVATLLLLNGKRVSPAPYADPNIGQGTSFNLNSIPLSAIERIEVLKDGASAVYGSDAIAGVVNIILRKDYKGADFTVTRGQQVRGGDYVTNTVNGSFGFGDLAKDKYNVLVAMEYYSRDPVGLRQSGNGIQNDAYAFLAGRLIPNSTVSYPANLRRESVANSGVFNVVLPLDPRCPPALTFGTLCRSDTLENRQTQSEAERKGALARATFSITPTLDASIEANFSRADNIFVGAQPGLDAAAPSTWFRRDGSRLSYTLFLPVGHPDNPNNFRLGLRYRFMDFGPSYTFVTTDTMRVVGGLSGTWDAWDWQSNLLFSKTKREEDANGQIYFPALQSAIANGTYRFFGTNSQAVISSLNPYKHNEGESKLSQVDLRGSRELGNLAGGSIGVAAGIEIRKEEMDIVSDPRTVNGEFIGLASSTVRGSRNVSSVFAELSLPFIKDVETQLAIRQDHYSDFGNSTTPKIGVKWKIHETVAARATYARGFRAPSLFQISNSNVQSFNAGIVDPVRCVNAQTTPDDCSRTISSLIQANTQLQPEKSSSHTLGVLWSPTKDWNASVDFWYIHRTNFIDRFDSQTVINNEFNPAFQGGSVIRDPNPLTWLPGVPNSGPIQSTIRKFDNFGGTAVRGIDFDLAGRISIGQWGRLGLAHNSSYYDEIKWQLGKGNVPYINNAGNFYVFEAPRYRGNTTVTWTKGDVTTFVRNNYVGRWRYGDPTVANNCYLAATSATLAYLGGAFGGCYVKEWSTVDIGATYSGIKNLTLSLIVRNVEGKAAPYDPNQTTAGFNSTFHNPYGRYMQGSISYRFR